MPNMLLRSSLLMFALIVCFLPITGTITAGEQKSINKVKAYLTTFLTDDQLHTILNNISIGCYQMKNITQLTSDAKTVVLSSLTGSQMMSVMPVYNAFNRDFGGLNAALEAMEPMFTALRNNLIPVLEQIQAKDFDWTNEGKGQTACIAQQYRMFNSFLTTNRMQTIMKERKQLLRLKIGL
uniref:Uncharacterized protein n=1 Tax=Ditylenchus dipsaci TaxID=166011 RepID=A0A915E7F4_9BILA